MLLVSENVEFRRSNQVEGKTGNTYYFHSFEDENGSFQFYCKKPINCEKGDSVKLLFEVSTYNGNNNFNLLGLYEDK